MRPTPQPDAQTSLWLGVIPWPLAVREDQDGAPRAEPAPWQPHLGGPWQWLRVAPRTSWSRLEHLRRGPADAGVTTDTSRLPGACGSRLTPCSELPRDVTPRTGAEDKAALCKHGLWPRKCGRSGARARGGRLSENAFPGAPGSSGAPRTASDHLRGDRVQCGRRRGLAAGASLLRPALGPCL